MITALSTTPFEAGFYALGIVSLVLLLWNIRLERKMRRLTCGKNAKSLEDTIAFIKEGCEDLARFRVDVEKYLKSVEERLRRSVQGIATVRFNPFKGAGVGGNQSFSTAFLSEDGNGVVVSTLHARDRMSFYSKPIEHFSSSHELSDEEKAAILQAREAVKVKR